MYGIFYWKKKSQKTNKINDDISGAFRRSRSFFSRCHRKFGSTYIVLFSYFLMNDKESGNDVIPAEYPE